MRIKAYSKKELALAYAPEITMNAALNRLALWIRTNTTLWQELLHSGYHPTQRYFTAYQVGLIFRYIGEP